MNAEYWISEDKNIKQGLYKVQVIHYPTPLQLAHVLSSWHRFIKLHPAFDGHVKIVKEAYFPGREGYYIRVTVTKALMDAEGFKPSCDSDFPYPA
ncbi:hypothetical protein AB3R30_25550 [Leptolyngbyaceae cyanobacterium UHCC 1019]